MKGSESLAHVRGRISARQEVSALRILTACPNFADQSAPNEPQEASSGRSRCQSDRAGDLAGQVAATVAKKSEDRLLGLVERWPGDSPKTQGHPKPRPDLFEHRRGEPGVPTGRRHPLNAAAPLFDEPE